MTEVEVISNGEFELRLTAHGDTYRVGAPSLARDLSFKDAHDMVRGLPEDEKGTEIVRTPGGDQRVLYVTEPGFYRLIGQRQVARIKDEAVRAMVVRFQDWVFRDVLPSIRKNGTYQPEKPAGLASGFDPTTWTWTEVVAIIRQRYGIDTSVIEFRRTLRSAGVLRQSGEPRRDYEKWFWFSGSSWAVIPHHVPALVRRYEVTRQALQGHSQPRLVVSGDELPFDDADVIAFRATS